MLPIVISVSVTPGLCFCCKGEGQLRSRCCRSRWPLSSIRFRYIIGPSQILVGSAPPTHACLRTPELHESLRPSTWQRIRGPSTNFRATAVVSANDRLGSRCRIAVAHLVVTCHPVVGQLRQRQCRSSGAALCISAALRPRSPIRYRNSPPNGRSRFRYSRCLFGRRVYRQYQREWRAPNDIMNPVTGHVNSRILERKHPQIPNAIRC